MSQDIQRLRTLEYMYWLMTFSGTCRIAIGILLWPGERGTHVRIGWTKDDSSLSARSLNYAPLVTMDYGWVCPDKEGHRAACCLSFDRFASANTTIAEN